MRKRIQFFNDSEVQVEDWNDVQTAVQSGMSELTTDFLQAAGVRGYTGLAVTRTNASAVAVSAGRYYDGMGQMWGNDAATAVDITPYLPSTGSRYIGIVVWGVEAQENAAYRDFESVNGTPQPASVYLELNRRVSVTIVAGVEAGTPTKPEIPATYLGVAWIELGTGGIADASSIEQITENEIVSLDDALGRITSLERFKKATNIALSSMRSDFSALSRQVKGLASTTAITSIMKEVARLREEIGLPDTYSGSHADNFMDTAEAKTTDPLWLAKIEDGIRFADANADESVIALLSSIDPLVTVTPGGQMLPAYTEEITLSIGDVASERDAGLPFAQYQTVTVDGAEITLSRLRQRYGETYLVCTNVRYWQTGEYDPVSGIFKKGDETWVVDNPSATHLNHKYVRTTRFFEDAWEEAYWQYGATDRSITGKALVQTRLSTSTRVVTSIDLRLKEVAAAGNMTLVVSDTDDRGEPDYSKIYATATIVAADLVVGWNKFAVEPFVRAAGQRLAYTWLTNGAHVAWVSTNNDFTQGQLYTLVDGVVQVALENKDICFQERCAKFVRTKTVVSLSPWNLDGGITGVDVMAPLFRTKSATVNWQFKTANSWHSLDQINGTTPFVGLPALVEARLVMSHTQDIAPIVQLPTSRVKLSRPRTDGRYISKPWTVSSAVTSVSLTLLLSSYDIAYHTIAPKLRHGAGYATVASPASVTTKTRKDGLVELVAAFTGLPSITSYEWDIAFTTSTALKPFVIEQAADATL